MKRHLGWFLGFILSVSAAWAQDAVQPDATANSTAASAAVSITDYWKKEVIANLNLNQASFSNWAQGGNNMISWQAGLNARLEHDNPAINWLNTLKLQYGSTYLANQGTQVSTDAIDLESVFAWKTWTYINPYVSISAQSQFGPGYNYAVNPAVEISNFLDPGYLTESAGLKYVPDKVFNTRLGLGLKETVASQFETPYTVNPSTGLPQSEITQFGLSWVSELNLKLSATSNIDSKLDTFWPGGSLDQTVLEWDNLLTFSFNKILSLNMEDDFRYDSRVYDGWQIKETLGLGIAYSLL